MGLRYRRSINLGAFRLNLSKSGIGWSVGNKRVRHTQKATGGTRTTYTLPGTGISHIYEAGGNSAPQTHYTPNGHFPAPPKKPKKTVWQAISLGVSLVFFLLGLLLLIAGVVSGGFFSGLGFSLLPLSIAFGLLNIYARFMKGGRTVMVCILMLFLGVVFIVMGAPDLDTSDSGVSPSAITISI